MRRALLSVSDKTGLVDFARGLSDVGAEILSTGGTHAAILKAGIKVTEIAAYTGFPEIMDGRVKTLHPKVHGGILARREQDGDILRAHEIDPIDLVVVNLYPFEDTIARKDVSLEKAIENIDIGGPAMLRSAAKNHADVLVVVDPADYGEVTNMLKAGGTTLEQRYTFAAKAFAHTASYDAAIASYLTKDEFPERLTLGFVRRDKMRYGENPHQGAAFYAEAHPTSGSIANYDHLQGKELSYNNVADTDAALECVKVFTEPACVIVKHANPCGVAVANNLCEAYSSAFSTDPTSAFGGIIAFNRRLDAKTLKAILDKQFAEVVVAPQIDAKAAEIAKTKKNLRLLEVGDFSSPSVGDSETVVAKQFKRVSGGLLVQEPDVLCLDDSALRCVTRREPTASEMEDLVFVWKVAWFVKSNAIVFARDGRTIGVGAGQMSRVISTKIAAMKAVEEGHDVARAVMASDAFFPFRDGIDAAAAVGIRAVIQPGGSMRDEEVIEAANEHDIAMLFTGIRHFRH